MSEGRDMTAQSPPGGSAPGWQRTAPPLAGPPVTRPPVTRPPLTGRAKRGAAVAGIVSFVLVNIGFALFALPIAVGLFVAVFAGILGIVRRSAGEADPGVRQFTEILEAVDLERWAVLLVLVSVLGVVIMVLALFASTWILKRHGVARHWPITWSATGIAVVANIVIGSVLSGILQGILSLVVQSTGDPVGGTIAVAVTWALGTLAINAAIGWLAWWWMVFVFRPAAAPSQ